MKLIIQIDDSLRAREYSLLVPSSEGDAILRRRKTGERSNGDSEKITGVNALSFLKSQEQKYSGVAANAFTWHRLFLKVEKKGKHSVSVEEHMSSTACSSGQRYQCYLNCSTFFLGHHRDLWLFIALHPLPPITDTVRKAQSERPSYCLF